MTRRQERDDFKHIIVCRHVAPSLEENVDSVVEQSNCVEMPPTNTTGGGGWDRVVSLSEANAAALLRIRRNSQMWSM